MEAWNSEPLLWELASRAPKLGLERHVMVRSTGFALGATNFSARGNRAGPTRYRFMTNSTQITQHYKGTQLSISNEIIKNNEENGQRWTG
jgi:hypothetical protein